MFIHVTDKDFDCGCPTGRTFHRDGNGHRVLRCKDCEALDVREFLAGNSEHSAQLLANEESKRFRSGSAKPAG